MWITCKCGHTDEFDRFCQTTMFGALPPGQFQCPACSTAWQRKEGDYRVITAGDQSMFIAGRVEILTVEARL